MADPVISLPYSDDDEVLYGEVGPISNENIAALIQRSRKHQSDERKRSQARRERILKSKHKDDIVDHLCSMYDRTFALRKLAPHVNLASNPFQDIVRQVVALYKSGAIRRIDGVTPEEQAAFDKLVTETRIDSKAQGFAESAYSVGPQFVLPTMRRQEMRLVAPSATTTDVVLDIEDPTGDPVAVSYAARDGVVIVDSVTSRFFQVSESGAVTEDKSQRLEHGVKELPAAPLRFTHAPEDDDWWDCSVHKRLEDGAMEVGHIAAKLSRVRKGQHGKLPVLKGALGEVPRGQYLDDPIKPVVLPTDGMAADDTRTPTFEAVDFDTDPKNHLSHLRAVVEWMSESTGVPVRVETNNGDQWDYTWDFDALAELRTSLLWFAMLWERQLWTFTVALAKAQRHPLANSLPSPEKVSAGFYLSLPPLHRKFADPAKEQDHWDWLMKRGLVSIIDIARRFIGHRSDEALDKQIKRNLEINGQWYDDVASRSRSAELTTDGLQTAAQVQGAKGPAVRDGKMPEPGRPGADNNAP